MHKAYFFQYIQSPLQLVICVHSHTPIGTKTHTQISGVRQMSSNVLLILKFYLTVSILCLSKNQRIREKLLASKLYFKRFFSCFVLLFCRGEGRLVKLVFCLVLFFIFMHSSFDSTLLAFLVSAFLCWLMSILLAFVFHILLSAV